MKRFALLVGSPDTGPQFLPGVAADINSLRRFLISIEGGAWEPNEILAPPDPDKITVQKIIQTRTRDVDYFFFHFSGHGRNYNKKDQIFLKDGAVDLDDVEAKCVCNKKLLVIDACRGVSMGPNLTATAGEMKKFSQMTREKSRTMFDIKVVSSEEGGIRAFSCQLNQAAGELEDGAGGAFTQALISGAIHWSKAHSTGDVLDILRAVECAKPRIKPSQVPVVPPIRRLNYFPFGIAN